MNYQSTLHTYMNCKRILFLLLFGSCFWIKDFSTWTMGEMRSLIFTLLVNGPLSLGDLDGQTGALTQFNLVTCFLLFSIMCYIYDNMSPRINILEFNFNVKKTFWTTWNDEIWRVAEYRSGFWVTKSEVSNAIHVSFLNPFTLYLRLAVLESWLHFIKLFCSVCVLCGLHICASYSLLRMEKKKLERLLYQGVGRACFTLLKCPWADLHPQRNGPNKKNKELAIKGSKLSKK